MRSPAGSACAACRRSRGRTRARAGSRSTIRSSARRRSCAAHHVEPTPCEREPGSGLGAPSPDVLHGTHLACPGSHGAWPNRRRRSTVRGASAPLTPFACQYPGPMRRALRRFGARALTGPLCACGSTAARIVDADASGARAATCAGCHCSRRRRSAARRCRSTRSRTRSPRRSRARRRRRPGRRRDERRRRQRRRAAQGGPGGGRRDASALARPARPRLRARVLLAVAR